MIHKHKLIMATCLLAGIVIGRYLWRPSGRYEFIHLSGGVGGLVFDTQSADIWLWEMATGATHLGKPWRPKIGTLVATQRSHEERTKPATKKEPMGPWPGTTIVPIPSDPEMPKTSQGDTQEWRKQIRDAAARLPSLTKTLESAGMPVDPNNRLDPYVKLEELMDQDRDKAYRLVGLQPSKRP